ncbi:hypothetical protein V8E36_006027 [Tilletia maclaganii]
MARTKVVARKRTAAAAQVPPPGPDSSSRFAGLSSEQAESNSHAPTLLEGTRLMREILKYQATDEPIIPRETFKRLVKDISSFYN